MISVVLSSAALLSASFTDKAAARAEAAARVAAAKSIDFRVGSYIQTLRSSFGGWTLCNCDFGLTDFVFTMDFEIFARGEVEGDRDVPGFEVGLKSFGSTCVLVFKTEESESSSSGNKIAIAVFASMLAFRTELALSLRLTATGS